MKLPTLAETSRFIMVMFAVLAVCLIARTILFESESARLGDGDIVIAIAAAVIVTGGWLRPKDGPK